MPNSPTNDLKALSLFAPDSSEAFERMFCHNTKMQYLLKQKLYFVKRLDRVDKHGCKSLDARRRYLDQVGVAGGCEESGK